MKKSQIGQLLLIFISILLGGSLAEVTAQGDYDWIISGQDMYANDELRYVGVGTTNPKSKLHVSGDFSLDSGNRIIFRNAAGLFDQTTLIRAASDAMRFRYNGNVFKFEAISNHAFQLHNSSAQPVFSINPAGHAFFLNNGNLGVGTSTPDSLLDVHGTARLRGAVDGTGLWVYGNGTVGIGTGSNPSQRSLQVYDVERPSLLLSGGEPYYQYWSELAVVTEDELLAPFSTAGDVVLKTNTGDVILAAPGSGNYVRIGTGNPCTERVTITDDGRVGIGTTNPGGYELNVNGKIRANEVVVSMTGSDFVFDESYHLLPLSDLQRFIDLNKHLPDIPPATDMQALGSSVGELQTKLLQKIEELTLYVLTQNERLNKMEHDNQMLKKALSQLSSNH